MEDWTKECAIDVDKAWEYATSHTCPVTADFGQDVLEVDSVKLHLHRALPSKVDFDKLSKYFLYCPRVVIRKTLKSTTQLAKAIINFLLKPHIRSHFQMLRQP